MFVFCSTHASPKAVKFVASNTAITLRNVIAGGS